VESAWISIFAVWLILHSKENYLLKLPEANASSKLLDEDKRRNL
jgi:hypothetical protein